MGRPFPRGDLDPHLTGGSLGPPKSSSIDAAVFAGLTSVTDRLTDRPRYLVGNNRPHLRNLRSTAMRPKNGYLKPIDTNQCSYTLEYKTHSELSFTVLETTCTS